ncbi:hypothetical protein [Bradyrhizobium sp. Ec3.3]|uniref:hypothetical protein n=1 Tax=Bradyrhizobium sp. Ec3.3 TaxID=189753 RepID=UPI00040C6D81|nr:hypothetical protein [Bradyrhizobium sp. Ec3.3]
MRRWIAVLVTPVYIICSASPQVGKTLIARLLSEFLLLKNGTVLSFDLNLKEPSLLDYLPTVTETADVMDTYGKMQLVDRLILNDSVAKVIDLGFHAFDEFFKMCDEIDFLSEAILHHVVPIVLFMPDIDRVSARAHEMLRRLVPPQILITVHNEFVVRGELFDNMKRGRVLRFAALPAFLNAFICRLGLSFTGYLRHEKDSSSELHQWIRQNYTSFRDLELSVIPQ